MTLFEQTEQNKIRGRLHVKKMTVLIITMTVLHTVPIKEYSF